MDMTASAARADLPAGPALYRFRERLYPICRSITGAGVRQTLATHRRSACRSRSTRCRSGTPGLRLADTAGVERRGCRGHRSGRPTGDRFPGAQPAPGRLFRAGADNHVARGVGRSACTFCPSTPTGFRTAPATTSAAGVSACAARDRARLRPGRYRVRDQDLARPGVAHLRRVGRFRVARVRRCCFSRTSAIPLWPTTTSAEWRSPPRWPNGSRATRGASPTASSLRPERSGH